MGRKRPRSCLKSGSSVAKGTVWFCEAQVMTVPVPNRDEQPRDDIWYSDNEYDRFKYEARGEAQSAKAQVEQLLAENSGKVSACRLAAVIPRGLESRISSERTKRKVKSLRTILEKQFEMRAEMARRRAEQLIAHGTVPAEAASSVNVDGILQLMPPTAQEVHENAQRLAIASEECTKWASRMAAWTASRDAKAVAADTTPVTTAAAPARRSSKRTVCEDDNTAEWDNDSIKHTMRRNSKKRRTSQQLASAMRQCSLTNISSNITMLEPMPIAAMSP